jgi:hypothetical protein
MASTDEDAARANVSRIAETFPYYSAAVPPLERNWGS